MWLKNKERRGAGRERKDTCSVNQRQDSIFSLSEASVVPKASAALLFLFTFALFSLSVPLLLSLNSARLKCFDDSFDYNTLEGAGAAAADAAAHFSLYISTEVIQSLSAFSTGSSGPICLSIYSNDTWMLPPLKLPPLEQLSITRKTRLMSTGV